MRKSLWSIHSDQLLIWIDEEYYPYNYLLTLLEIPDDAYTVLRQNVIGCSTLRQEFSMLIGRYCKILKRNFWTLLERKPTWAVMTCSSFSCRVLCSLNSVLAVSSRPLSWADRLSFWLAYSSHISRQCSSCSLRLSTDSCSEITSWLAWEYRGCSWSVRDGLHVWLITSWWDLSLANKSVRGVMSFKPW